MINLIWALMAVIGIIYAMFNGTLEAVNESIFINAQEAVTLTLYLMSTLIFWLGMMKIAEAGGLLTMLGNLFKPFIRLLFPELPKGHPAIGYILSNITANLFGLGNAATPMGLKAMKEMQKLNRSKTASRSMITFLALNTSGLTIIPTTVIAIRLQYGSISPTEIVGTTLIATIVSTIAAIMLDRMFYHIEKNK